MYKLLGIDELTNDTVRMVNRLSDNAHIPFDPANTDYQEYLEWIAAGNTPEAAE